MGIMTDSDLVEALVKDRHNAIIFYENVYPALSLFKRVLDKTKEEITILAISNPVLKTLNEIMEHTDLNLKGAKIVTLNMGGEGKSDMTFSYKQTD